MPRLRQLDHRLSVWGCVMTATRRAPRSFTLTMLGYQAAWQFEQAEQLAARPVTATAACACCDEVYVTKGLKRLDSDTVYYQAASRECSFERDALVCAPCRRSFEASYGSEKDDVYHVFNRGHDWRD